MHIITPSLLLIVPGLVKLIAASLDSLFLATLDVQCLLRHLSGEHAPCHLLNLNKMLSA